MYLNTQGGWPELTPREDWLAIQDEDAYYDGLYNDRELTLAEKEEVNKEHDEWIQQVLKLYDELESLGRSR